MTDDLDAWELLTTDDVSGRTIYKRDTTRENARGGANYGTHDFTVHADFEVRHPDGTVLLRTAGSAKGEYWCGVFLWFVEGSAGTQVRLEESGVKTPQIIDIAGK